MANSEKFRILCVCTANICRSPVAGLLSARLGPDVTVSSAGTFGLEGLADRTADGTETARGIESEPTTLPHAA